MPSVISKIKGRLMGPTCCSPCRKNPKPDVQSIATHELQRDVDVRSYGLLTTSPIESTSSPITSSASSTESTTSNTESIDEERRLMPTEEKIFKLWDRWGKRMNGYRCLATYKHNPGHPQETGSFNITDNTTAVNSNRNSSSNESMYFDEDDGSYQNLPCRELEESSNVVEMEANVSTPEQFVFNVVSTPQRCVFDVMSLFSERRNYISNVIQTSERSIFNVIPSSKRCDCNSTPVRFINVISPPEQLVFDSDYLDMSALHCDLTPPRVYTNSECTMVENSFSSTGQCYDEPIYMNMLEVNSAPARLENRGACSQLPVPTCRYGPYGVTYSKDDYINMPTSI